MRAPTETALVRAVIKCLGLHGWMAWRNNTGGLRIGKRLVRFGTLGSGDVFALKDGVFLSLECKMPGNTPTAHQQAWMELVSRSGGVGAVIRSLQELDELLTRLEA